MIGIIWIGDNRSFCFDEFLFCLFVFDTDTPKDGGKDEKYNIVCEYVYSIDENHPHYAEPAQGHVRGKIYYTSYLFMQKADASGDEKNWCDMIYILSIDPSGKIPQRVVNYSAPAQGMNVKGWRDNVALIKQHLEKRKQDNKDKK